MLHLLNHLNIKIHCEWGSKGLIHRYVMWCSKLNKVCKPKSHTSMSLIVLITLQHFGKHFSSMIVMLCNCEMSYYAISSIRFLRLIHVVQCSWVTMLFYSIMLIHGLFICLWMDIWIISLFEIIPCAAMHLSVHISEWASVRVSLRYIFSSRITESQGRCMLNCIRSVCFPKCLHQFI